MGGVESVRVSDKTFTREYVEARIQIDEKGCWNWTGALNNSGHPIGMGYAPMHRVVKMLYDGHVFQPRQMADHTCRNSKCINPDHLRITNRQVNQQHREDAKTGTMAMRRLRVVRYLHDQLTDRYRERVHGQTD